tara:strand:- start:721 stop:1797 length:1077 start_codon:yes stop_codon:yes gene_type:complete
MSVMLEQAIIDAEALKEAALKNAEAAIIEKYSDEIREAVDSLLDEEEAVELNVNNDLEDIEALPQLEEQEVVIDDEEVEELPEIPMAHQHDAECGCPDHEDGEVEIELDLGALTPSPEEMTSREEIVEEAPLEEEAIQEEDTLEEAEETLQEEEVLEEEEIEINEEDIAEIVEELTVDVTAVPSGVPGGGTNHAQLQDLANVIAAENAQIEAEGEKFDEEKIELEEAFKQIYSENQEILGENKKYKDLLMQMKERLEEVNLSNAKLLYTNRVLGSTSLNERQKTKIVEAISKTDSVEEAKVVFETLQSAVGAIDRKRSPKSLSEAVTRKSSTTLRSRKAKKTIADPVSNRWKALAGIE